VLTSFLRDNADIFAWTLSDMPGVPRELVEHSLDVSKTAKPVKQKLHRFAKDRKEVIRVEVLKLFVVWTSLGPLPRWVPGPTTRWASRTTRLVPHDT
jgi:hypothetical protein